MCINPSAPQWANEKKGKGVNESIKKMKITKEGGILPIASAIGSLVSEVAKTVSDMKTAQKQLAEHEPCNGSTWKRIIF